MTETVRVSKKYQVVIPKQARDSLKIDQGDELVVSIREGQVIMKPKPKSYTKHMRGLHKNLWKDIDTTKYVEKEREAWT
ncbi:MAG: AbrB/MazE/SpoVT family DNA-binding domain-containing protein [Candidatus Bathyarchaeia archaeon]